MGTPMSWLETTCHFLCTFEDSALASVGVDPSIDHYALSGASMVSTALFLLIWMNAFPRLRRNGFSKLVWSLMGWFVLLMGFFQVAQFMLPSFGYQAVPCPYSTLIPASLATVFCGFVYVVHIFKGNKGTLSDFMIFVAGPAVGETVAASKTVATIVVRVVHLVST
jgi:hypothetical protein